MELHGAAYCVSSKVLFYSPVLTESYIQEIMSDEALKKRFSQKALRIALAYGITEEIKKYLDFEKQTKPGSPKSLEFLNIVSQNTNYGIRHTIYRFRTELLCRQVHRDTIYNEGKRR